MVDHRVIMGSYYCGNQNEGNLWIEQGKCNNCNKTALLQDSKRGGRKERVCCMAAQCAVTVVELVAALHPNPALTLEAGPEAASNKVWIEEPAGPGLEPWEPML